MTEYTFYITPEHLREWAREHDGTTEGTTISTERALEVMFEMLFSYAPNYRTAMTPHTGTYRCDDRGFTEGTRAVELETIQPLTASSTPVTIYRVTATDTTGNIEDIKRALRRETLLDEDRRLGITLRDVTTPYATEPADTMWVYLLGIVLLCIAGYLIS